MEMDIIVKELQEKIKDPSLSIHELQAIAHDALSALYGIDDDLSCEMIAAGNNSVPQIAVERAVQKNMYLLEAHLND